MQLKFSSTCFFWRKTCTVRVQNTQFSFGDVLPPCWLSRMGSAIGIAPAEWVNQVCLVLRWQKSAIQSWYSFWCSEMTKAAHQGGMPTEEEGSSSALLCDWDWLCCCWVEQRNAVAAPAPALWCFCSRLCWLTFKKIWYTDTMHCNSFPSPPVTSVSVWFLFPLFGWHGANIALLLELIGGGEATS